MQKQTLALVALLAILPAAAIAQSELQPFYQVGGVQGEDMLKMRAGPGTGFRVVLGLPNGTVLRVYGCEQTGSTRWCQVSLKQARGLRGYVSWAYLRDM